MISFTDLPFTQLKASLMAWEARPNSIEVGYDIVKLLDRFIYNPELAFSYHGKPGLANLKPRAYEFLEGSERAREILERVVLKPNLRADLDCFLAKFLAENNRYLLPVLSPVQKQMLKGVMRSSTTDLGMLVEGALVRSCVYSAALTECGNLIVTACKTEKSKILATLAGEVSLLAPKTLEIEKAVFTRCAGVFNSLREYCQPRLNLGTIALGTIVGTGVMLLVIYPLDSFLISSLS